MARFRRDMVASRPGHDMCHGVTDIACAVVSSFRFFTTSDGLRIAYAVIGQGPVRVWVPGWISHLEASWESPETRADIEHWARNYTIVRYDKRGTGLCQRDIGDYSINSRTQDLDAVVNDLQLDRFSLSGVSEGGPVAISYAAQQAHRVSHLILIGSFARNPFRGREEGVHALAKLIEAEWGLGSKTIANAFYPDASAEQVRQYARYERESASGQDAAAMILAMMDVDVLSLLPSISVPTLLIHGKRDQTIPLECSIEMAAAIPQAQSRATPLLRSLKLQFGAAFAPSSSPTSSATPR
jgi:pimeloyl-ACP methyl ester carboxylesterase